MKQKQNFATSTSITSTYAGEFAGKYIAAALLSGKTLAERAITIVPNVKFKQVIGHGLNKQELEANPHLNKHWVQNLNSNQKLPIESNLVDAVLIVAGWQYLQYPEAVSSELLRITSPGGIIIVSFSNRMFSTKAPRAWLDANDSERLFGISKILSNQGWIVEQIINKNSLAEGLLGLFGGNGDPFLSIIARATKNK